METLYLFKKKIIIKKYKIPFSLTYVFYTHFSNSVYGSSGNVRSRKILSLTQSFKA